MLEIVVEPSSVERTQDYLERTKLKIFEKMREGMQEAMEGLAGEVVLQASAAGIQSRTGQLFRDILKSPRVKETPELVIGRVSTLSKMKIGGREFQGYLGTALDQGFTVPASSGKRIRFTTPQGGVQYSMGHKTIHVGAHEFLRRAKENFSSPILEIIAARVAEAFE